MSEKPVIVSEYVRCDLCGSADHELLYSKIDPVTGGEFHLVQCECGMAYVNPMPVEESIVNLYHEDYHHGKAAKTKMYQRMLKCLQGASGKKLLDIGCGRGEFLHYASKEGWDPYGVDIIEWESRCNVPIRIGNFLTMDLGEDAFDVVTAWAVLEHVRQPSLYFEKISRILRENGRLILAVPNIAAPGMKHSCTEDIPRHLWLFTPTTVRKFLKEYGMTALSVRHNSGIYTAYPFDLVRYGLDRVSGGNGKCADYANKAVARLRNRQIRGNLVPWMSEALRDLSLGDLLLDTVDIAFGVCLANVSKLIRNYGIITVVAVRDPHSTP